jgi:acyl carrier protein
MMWETLKTAIQEILNIQDDSEITENTTFVDDLGADSLEIFQIIMLVEQKMDIEIPEESLEGIVTIGDALLALRSAAE